MKSVILYCCILLLLPVCSLAQQKISFDNVRKAYVRNSGTINDREEIKGYFTFYITDKKGRSTNEYTIRILDANLNKIKDIVFEDEANKLLLESSYNGNSIMFLFLNLGEKSLEYRAYDFDGKVKSSYTRELNGRSRGLIETTYNNNSEEGQNEALHSVNDNGFVTVYPVKEGKYYSYEVNFFFSDRKKEWTYEAAEEQEDKVASALYLGATDSLLLFEVVKQKRMLTGSPHSWLLALNIFTGKRVFEITTEAEDYKFYPMNVIKEEGTGNVNVIGTYYEPDDRIVKDASLGLANWLINSKGTILNKRYNSWTGPISKFLPTDQKGRVDDVGFIYFHRILRTDDGNYFAIGEGYKKVVSGWGVASNLLRMGNSFGGGTSAFKIKITDLVTLQFNPKFEITNATIYDKRSNSMDLPAGSSYLTPHVMALMAKAWGVFDYEFTQTDNNHSRFSIGYSDYEKTDEYKGNTFNAITYSDGKTTRDKINLKSKSSWMRILPGKPGFVMVMEYFRKEKRMDLRLEKIN